MKGYEVIISEDKVVYKTLGEFETPQQFEETLPTGFEKVSYNNILVRGLERAQEFAL